MLSLQNKTAVITGASSGIGKQIASALAESGMRVCLLGRNTNALKETLAAIRKTSPESIFHSADFTSDSEIDETCNYLLNKLESLDVLVHSAGIFSYGPLEASTRNSFDRLFSVNVRAPYIITQSFLPMLKRSKGQVVFINSSAGLNAGANWGQYSATKFALKGLADSFRQEVNSTGIRVLSVYPGRTASPMQEAIFRSEGKEYRPDLLMQPADLAAIILSVLTLPSSAEVTDINIRPLAKIS